MSKTRQKREILPTTITKQQAEEAFADFAEADAKQQQVTAKMDEQITKIRDKYSADLTAYAATKDGAFEIMQTYAENNRDDFGKKKSMELTHGVIGFRTGTPALKTASKKFTWESITTLLGKLYPDYVRQKSETDKEKILANRAEPKVIEMIKECGMVVFQAETFFVEPKKELAEA